MARRFDARGWSRSSGNERPNNKPGSSTTSSHSRRPRLEKVSKANSPFGYFYISQFPVWAARWQNPALKTDYILIHRKGQIVSACLDSMVRGVRVGWSLARAESLCPEAKVIAYDPGEIAMVWDEILRDLYQITPCLEPVCPGRLFFDPPTQLDKLADLSRLTRDWQAQACIGPDRPTAEIGALIVLPGVLRRLRPERDGDFLERVPTMLLVHLGLSESIAERLQWFGFFSVADMRVLSREQIAGQFAVETARGDIRMLWRYARAGTGKADRQPVATYQPPACKDARIVFPERACSPREWERGLWDVVLQGAAALNGLSSGLVTITLNLKSGVRQASKLLREPVSSARTLYRVCQDLLMSRWQRGDELEAVEIRLSHLTTVNTQGALFDVGRYTKGKRALPPRLTRTLNSLQNRFPNSVMRCLERDPHAVLPEDRTVYAALENQTDGP